MKFKSLNKIFFIIFFSISLFLLAYIFYKSEIFAEGNKHSYYFKYYLLSFILIFFSISLLFLEKKTLFTYFAIMIFSSLTIYSVEFHYTLKVKSRTLSKYNYYKEAKKENPDIVPIVYYFDQVGLKIDTSIIPLASVAKKLSIFCQEDGSMIEYFSDRYGFNNFDSIWDQKNIFAVTIGDSFTHGACVDRKNTIANKINNNESVLNLGMAGTGPLIQLATVKEYLNAINTKRIIWIYYEENDLADLMIEQRDKILKKYLENEKFSQNLTLKQKLIDEKLTNIITYKEENIEKITIKESFKNFIKLHNVRRNFFDKNKNYNVSVPQSFSQIINTVKKIAEEKNLKFYFVYLPEKKRYKYNLDKDEKYRNYSEVSNIIKEANIDLIDIKKEFYKISNPIQLYSKNGAHLNIEGYEKVAKFIFHKIQEFEK